MPLKEKGLDKKLLTHRKQSHTYITLDERISSTSFSDPQICASARRMNVLTLAGTAWGIKEAPLCVFLKWPPKRWTDCAEILQRQWDAPCATFEGQNWYGQTRSRSHDVIIRTTSYRFFTKIAFSANNMLTGMEILCVIESMHDHNWHLTLCLDLSKLILVQRPWPIPN